MPAGGQTSDSSPAEKAAARDSHALAMAATARASQVLQGMGAARPAALAMPRENARRKGMVGLSAAVWPL